jgi:magnesium chelatase subunit H
MPEDPSSESVLPETLASDRDRRVTEVYEQLIEIEERLIPTGLHVFGRAGELRQRADLLRMVAAFPRPELGARALPDLIREGLSTNEQSSAPGHKDRCDQIVVGSIDEFLSQGLEAALEYLKTNAKVEPVESRPVFTVLKGIAQELEANHELEALLRALRGEYIEPGPGADIVQNPAILPTGRNTHAVNPYSVPSPSAFARAEHTASALLERYLSEHGRYPRAMALVLWGLDNIKTQGEGVAQALWLLGVRPIRDTLNRVTEIEIIPHDELKRPRIDLVMTVSGIFRDLFAPTMTLLDKAVRKVAALDEPADLNYVKANVAEQIESEHCEFDDAALRVFSNAPGNYGANVNFMVLDSQWQQDEMLGDLFVTRKSFAYGRDSLGQVIEGREARRAMDRALARVEATYQNIDSFEVGITDVDHYFEYLGGISKAVEQRAQSRPAIYLSDALAAETKIRSLEETVRLETRAKTLNPKWYEGMLKHGFRGVAEIENHISNTFGWSATADAVDDWIYDDVAETFVLDEAMLDRLRHMNPHSVRALVNRLLEANARGYWDVDDATRNRLRDIVSHIEDQLEGVAAS